jgi:hypothetical protein
MSSPWCWACEIGAGDIFSGYCNNILDKKLAKILWEPLRYILMLYFFKPWTGFVSQGNEFSYYMLICSSFILNQYDNLYIPNYLLFILHNANDISILTTLPALKRLMNGLYILGYTVTAILFQTMINFGLFLFLISIPQGTHYPMYIISASIPQLYMMHFLLYLQKCDLW